MADAYINILLNDEKTKQLQEAGLAEQVKTIDGKPVLQVGMTAKDQKKLSKGFENLQFDDAKACVLPEKAEETLWKIILDMKSTDVMKFAITKLYNPLAGRDVFGRGSTGGR
jgi:hypothetical protein